MAKRLAANGTRPSDFRTAVSRAYYGVYHIASDELTKLGCTLPTDFRGHKSVREHLDKSGDDELKQLGVLIANLHAQRREADYRLSQTRYESQRTVQNVVERAERCVVALSKRLTSPDGPKLAATIKAAMA